MAAPLCLAAQGSLAARLWISIIVASSQQLRPEVRGWWDLSTTWHRGNVPSHSKPWALVLEPVSGTSDEFMRTPSFLFSEIISHGKQNWSFWHRAVVPWNFSGDLMCIHLWISDYLPGVSFVTEMCTCHSAFPQCYVHRGFLCPPFCPKLPVVLQVFWSQPHTHQSQERFFSVLL